MQITVIDRTGNEQFIGNTVSNIPIPRIGEKIDTGCNLPTEVADVVYDYKREHIWIFIDGFIITE
jgi:hypothetical protein